MARAISLRPCTTTTISLRIVERIALPVVLHCTSCAIHLSHKHGSKNHESHTWSEDATQSQVTTTTTAFSTSSQSTMPRPSSDIQWPESSSDDDFVPRKEFRVSDGKATKPTVTTTQVSRSKKQKRSPKATLSNAPLSKKPLNHSFERSDDEDIVSTIGEMLDMLLRRYCAI